MQRIDAFSLRVGPISVPPPGATDGQLSVLVCAVNRKQPGRVRLAQLRGLRFVHRDR